MSQYRRTGIALNEADQVTDHGTHVGRIRIQTLVSTAIQTVGMKETTTECQRKRVIKLSLLYGSEEKKRTSRDSLTMLCVM